MSLSDYATAAEKIAALKCAMMDPALVEYGTNFTVSENIFVLNNYFSLNGNDILTQCDNSDTFHNRLVPGDVITSPLLLYVKDSNITYSDPVVLYQNRLLSIMTREIKISNNVTAGTNGIIATRLPGQLNNKTVNYVFLRIDGVIVLAAPKSQMGTKHLLPIPSGSVVTSSSNSGYPNKFTYFDVPSDW